MSKTALITGITGQDGAYLAELLLKKGYEVHGIKRRASSFNTDRIDHLYQDPHEQGVHMRLHYGDLTDATNLIRIVQQVQPDEIYNLAAQSHVAVSFETPEYTANSDAMGTLRLLEAIRILGLEQKTRFYQASTSEMFGKVQEMPQKETTPFYPRSPYGAAKVYAYWITVNYREAYGLYACNGILFNHESPIRGETFVTRKITRGLARISQGLEQYLYLGNLDSLRDWGHARDYVEAQWLMLQQDAPEDFVIATGEQHSVREFVELVGARARHDASNGAARAWTSRVSTRRPARTVVKVDAALLPAHRGGDAAGRSVQGARQAGLDAGHQLRAAGRGDGRCRPRARAPRLGHEARRLQDLPAPRIAGPAGARNGQQREDLRRRPRGPGRQRHRAPSARRRLRQPAAAGPQRAGPDASRPTCEAFFAAQRPEYVFVAAAKVGGIHANNTYPAEFLRDNLAIQTNLIDAAYRNGTRKFQFLGSSCIYPKLAPQPMNEDCLLTGPLEPTNEWYAIAKIAGLKMCQAYRRQYGFNAISLMPTNLYGPGDNFDLQNSHVLPALMRKFHEAKRARRRDGRGLGQRHAAARIPACRRPGRCLPVPDAASRQRAARSMSAGARTSASPNWPA